MVVRPFLEQKEVRIPAERVGMHAVVDFEECTGNFDKVETLCRFW